MSGDLVTPFFQYGVTVTSAVIAVLLFVWTQIRTRGHEETIATNTKILATIADNQQKILDNNRALATGLIQLTETAKTHTADHHEQLLKLNELVQESKTLAMSQLNTMTSLQRVIEQLIGALRE